VKAHKPGFTQTLAKKDVLWDEGKSDIGLNLLFRNKKIKRNSTAWLILPSRKIGKTNEI